MKPTSKALALVGLILFSYSATAASDDVLIRELYFKEDGTVAIQTVDPLISANKEQTCGTGQSWTNYLAGISGGNSALKDQMVSLILLAHSKKKVLRIQTQGCIEDMHEIISVQVL